MKLIDGQILVTFARVLYRHAEVVSGAYKFRQTERGCGTNPDGTIRFRPLTDDEKLKDSLATLKHHVHFIQDCVDAIGELEDPGDPNAE